jgi:hypothetical protein
VSVRNIYFTLFFCLIRIYASAQVGGKSGFGFLRYPVNAHTAAIGGLSTSIINNDPSMMFNNPALLNKEMDKRIAANISPFVAGITYSTASFAFENNKLKGISGVGVQYMNYGSAREMDATGVETGTILSSNDFAISASHSHTRGNYTLGASVKLMGSQLARSSAIGMAVDIGAIFKHPTKDFTLALLVKNVGFPIKSYGSAFSVGFPLDVQLGVSFKPEHMPFRFSTVIHHLHRYSIAYDDPNRIDSYDINGNPIINRVSIAENIAQHFVFGGELLLSKGFNVKVGYNHMRRAELRNIDEGGLSGFSLGFMLKIKVVELAYSHAFYHSAGGINMFSIIFKPTDFYKKAQAQPAPTETQN